MQSVPTAVVSLFSGPAAGKTLQQLDREEAQPARKAIVTRSQEL
jgi:hypothetical protein